MPHIFLDYCRHIKEWKQLLRNQLQCEQCRHYRLSCKTIQESSVLSVDKTNEALEQFPIYSKTHLVIKYYNNGNIIFISCVKRSLDSNDCPRIVKNGTLQDVITTGVGLRQQVSTSWSQIEVHILDALNKRLPTFSFWKIWIRYTTSR